MKKKAPSSQFCFEGRFIGFVVDRGKVKFLRLLVADTEVQIKLKKEVRAALFRALEQAPSSMFEPWETIQVLGEETCDRETGICKRVAQQVLKQQTLNQQTLNQPVSNSCPRKMAQKTCDRDRSSEPVKLLMCQKSKCQNRGSKKQRQAIEATLCKHGLQHRVTIQESGCLGKCSMAPNVMLVPGKKRLSGMHPEAIADLIGTVCLS